MYFSVCREGSLNCTGEKCRRECPEFTCNDGMCLNFTMVCNGRMECPDGSDEYNCNSKFLSKYQFIYNKVLLILILNYFNISI